MLIAFNVWNELLLWIFVVDVFRKIRVRLIRHSHSNKTKIDFSDHNLNKNQIFRSGPFSVSSSLWVVICKRLLPEFIFYFHIISFSHSQANCPQCMHLINKNDILHNLRSIFGQYFKSPHCKFLKTTEISKCARFKNCVVFPSQKYFHDILSIWAIHRQ